MSRKKAGDTNSDLERIEKYLAALQPEQRLALEKLRKQIRSAAPGAVERISYGLPAFDLNGPLVGYGAAKGHCSFYPMNGTTVAAFADELATFDTSKGAIRFDPRRPLPATLVKKIVRSRVQEKRADMPDSAAAGKPAAKRVVKKKTAQSSPKSGHDDVDAFIATLKHPLKAEIAAIRAIILAVDRKIAEGVKWNSVSFRTADYFATINLRSTNTLQLVLHRGAKSKDGERQMKISDPKGLIKFLSSDRCLVTLGKGAEIAANKAAIRSIIKAWISQL